MKQYRKAIHRMEPVRREASVRLMPALLALAALWGISCGTPAQTRLTTSEGEVKISRDVTIEGPQEVVTGVTVDSPSMEHHGESLDVAMRLGLSGLKVKRNRAVLLTPRLVNGGDSLDLPSVGVYGRRRYYYYIRQGESMLSGKGEESYKAKEMPSVIDYSRAVPFSAWMNGADLTLRRQDYGCCNTLLAEQEGWLGHHLEAFFPELVYIRPEADREKTMSIEGSAFIDFPVDKTDIYPDYHDNTAELGKIRATVDSVRSDGDYTVTGVWLKGYASPEGSYAHNVDLAKGRTASLEGYVRQLYRFDDGILTTAYEPENWAGLRQYVEGSNLDHRAEILDMIDAEGEPDAKEAKIKRTYPQEYSYLLKNCYPWLRRTDYKVTYTIRSFSDVEEIKQVMQTHPQKLSLNEFYLVAQEYEPGTDEFTEVFETAVRLFPDDETANLNAANAAIRRDDYKNAERYLDRAGDTPEATYARAALAIRRRDFATARTYLEQAKAQGLRQAAVTLDELERGRR